MKWKFWKKEKKLKQVLDWKKQCFKIGGYIYTFYEDVFMDEDGIYYNSNELPIDKIKLHIVDPFMNNIARTYEYGCGLTPRKLWLQALPEYKCRNNLIEDKVPEMKKWAEEIKNKFETLKNTTYSHKDWANVTDGYYNVTLLKKYVDSEGFFYITVKYSDLFGEKVQEENRKMSIEYFQLFEDNYHNELIEIK